MAKNISKPRFKVGDSDHTTKPRSKTRITLSTTQNAKWYKQFNLTRLEAHVNVFYKFRGYLTQNKRIVDRNQNAQRIEVITIEYYFNHLKHNNRYFDKTKPETN